MVFSDYTAIRNCKKKKKKQESTFAGIFTVSMEIRFGTQVWAYETWTKTEYLQALCTKAISFLLLQFQVAFIFRTFGGSFLLNMRKITFLWKCSKTLKFYVFNSTLNEYTLVTAEREIKTAGFSLSGISCISRRILHKPLPEPQFSYLQDEWEIRIMIFFPHRVVVRIK